MEKDIEIKCLGCICFCRFRECYIVLVLIMFWKEFILKFLFFDIWFKRNLNKIKVWML